MRKVLLVVGLLAVLLSPAMVGSAQETDEWEQLAGDILLPGVPLPARQQASLTLLQKYPLTAQQVTGGERQEMVYAHATLLAANYLGDEQHKYAEALKLMGAILSVFWHSDSPSNTGVYALYLRYLLRTNPAPQEALAAAQAAGQWLREGLTLTVLWYDLSMHEYGRNMLTLYERGGQSQAGVSFLEDLPILRPDLIHELWYWTLLAETYTGLQQMDKAKQAAVLGLRLCPFDPDSVRTSLELLLGAAVLGGDRAATEAFLQYLKTGAGDNPCAQVPMPQLTDQQVDQMLANTGGLFTPLVNAYLYAGQFERAVQAAQQEVVSLAVDETQQAAQTSKGILDIARCFKAKDMHLLRANQFIVWVKTGEGENPLEDF